MHNYWSEIDFVDLDQLQKLKIPTHNCSLVIEQRCHVHSTFLTDNTTLLIFRGLWLVPIFSDGLYLSLPTWVSNFTQLFRRKKFKQQLVINACAERNQHCSVHERNLILSLGNSPRKLAVLYNPNHDCGTSLSTMGDFMEHKNLPWLFLRSNQAKGILGICVVRSLYSLKSK